MLSIDLISQSQFKYKQYNYIIIYIWYTNIKLKMHSKHAYNFSSIPTKYSIDTLNLYNLLHMAFPHFVNASPIPNPTIPHANTFGQSFPISQLSLYIVASLLQRISRHVFAVACGFASSWRKYYNSRYGSCRFSFSRDHFNRTVYFTRSLVLLYVCV